MFVVMDMINIVNIIVNVIIVIDTVNENILNNYHHQHSLVENFLNKQWTDGGLCVFIYRDKSLKFWGSHLCS